MAHFLFIGLESQFVYVYILNHQVMPVYYYYHYEDSNEYFSASN